MAAMQRVAYVIDAPIFFFRSHFAFRHLEKPLWVSNDGADQPTHGVRGYTQFLLDLITQRPTYLAAAFDGDSKKCWRKEIHSAYKKHRGRHNDNVAYQLAACREVTELLKVQVYQEQTYEADDLIAALCLAFDKKGARTCIWSYDKDLVQLVTSDSFSICTLEKGKVVETGKSALEAKWGVKTTQMAQYLGLVGDAADGIGGVPSIGVKKAQALLSKYDTVHEALSHPDGVRNLPIRGAKTISDTLQEYLSTFERNLELITLPAPIPLPKARPRMRQTKHLDFKETQALLWKYGICDTATMAKLEKACNA